jgi:hypothetical protein
MIICSLPEVRVRSSGDGNGSILDFIAGGLSGPLELPQVDLAAVRKSLDYTVNEFGVRGLLSRITTGNCAQAEAKTE